MADGAFFTCEIMALAGMVFKQRGATRGPSGEFTCPMCRRFVTGNESVHGSATAAVSPSEWERQKRGVHCWPINSTGLMACPRWESAMARLISAKS
jgi:hypothetical protein